MSAKASKIDAVLDGLRGGLLADGATLEGMLVELRSYRKGIDPITGNSS